MFSTSDTIVAIATPPGRGGIGVVRVSGPEAHEIARRLITHDRNLGPRHATLTYIRLKPAASYFAAASSQAMSLATSADLTVGDSSAAEAFGFRQTRAD